jgi:hypothetical protein
MQCAAGGRFKIVFNIKINCHLVVNVSNLATLLKYLSGYHHPSFENIFIRLSFFDFIFLWYNHLNPSKSAFFHALTLSLFPKNHMLFIVSKQCACSRRVHIEGHMNRFEFLLSWTIIPITIVLGLFLSKNRIFCSITRC